MARQIINIGSSANDGTGDPLRTAFDKINDNFLELYGTDSDASTLEANLDVKNYIITTSITNGDITLTPNGTGKVNLGSVTINGTTFNSNDSSKITLAESVDITGNTYVAGTVTVASTLNTANINTTGNFTITGNTVQTGNITQTGNQSITGQLDVDAVNINGSTVSTNITNGNLNLSGNGTGNIVIASDISGTFNTTQTGTITVTGQADIDYIQIKDNKVTTNSSNADLELSANGSGVVVVNDTLSLNEGNIINVGDINVDSISSDNGTDFDIVLDDNSATALEIKEGSTTYLTFDTQNTSEKIVPGIKIEAGAVEIEGSNFDINGGYIDNAVIGSNQRNTAYFTTVDINTSLTVDGVFIKDNKIITNASDSDLELEANGSGSIVFKSNVQFPENENISLTNNTLSVTGEVNIDNLNIDGNTITAIATNTSINLVPNGAGTVVVQGDLQANVLSGVSLENDQIQIAGNRIQTTESNADLQLKTAGTGVIDFETQTQSTVGSAGGASALPATPSGYINIKINGAEYVIPYYAKS